MPSDNAILGSEAFDGFVRALHLLKIYPHITTRFNTSTGIRLRIATFNVLQKTVQEFLRAPYSEYKAMVVEEYLTVIDNRNGTKRVAIEVYQFGQWPDLESRCVTIV